MAISADLFKSLMSRWASGVTVVTCRREAGLHGMTASSFTSVSLDPPLVLICVDRRNRTHTLIEEQKAFGLHILRRDQEEISNQCAGFRGESGNQLPGAPFHTEVTGAPILDDTLAWMDCRLWQTYDGGDHSIFVGEIVAAGTQDGDPLLWYSRGYAGAVRGS